MAASGSSVRLRGAADSGGNAGLVTTLLQSPSVVIASVAVASSVVTAGAILATQRLSRRHRRSDLEDHARRATGRPPSALNLRKAAAAASAGGHEKGTTEADEDVASTDGGTPRYLSNLAASHERDRLRPSSLRRTASFAPYDESLVREQLARHHSFLGDEGMAALRGAFVIVVGAGGVGSTCALSLVRAGVGAIRLIDFDQVSLSSLNRHAVATLADVGRPKVVVCAEHFARIAPWAHVEAWVELFKGDEAARLLGPSRPTNVRGAPPGQQASRKPTYVIDAIDNLDTKVDLLAYCYRNGIKVFSSMGAGAKQDPSRIQVADLADTSEDPLSRHVRRKLRLLGIPSLPEPRDLDKPQDTTPGGVAQKARSDKGRSAQQLRQEADKAAKKLPEPATPVKEKSTTGSLTPARAEKGKLPSPGSTSPLLPSQGHLSPRPSRIPRATSPTPRLGKSSAPPSTWSASAAPTSPQPMANDGFSRHMRRASSASSMGSAAFHTPLSTPQIGQEFEEGDDTIRLPDAALTASPGESAVVDETLTSPRIEEPRRRGSSKPPLDVPPYDVERRDSLVDLSASPMPSPLAPPSSAGAKQERNPLSRAASTLGPPTSSTPPISRSASPAAAEKARSGKPHAGPKPAAYARVGIPVVFSTEAKSDVRLLPLPQDEYERGNVEELAALEDFRVRILPVLGPIPAMFGLAASAYVICDIAGRPMEPFSHKPSRKYYERLVNDLEASERKFPPPGQAPMHEGTRRCFMGIEDCAYLHDEVFHQRSIVPPFESPSRGVLIRWDSTLPLSYANVALFTREQAKKHEVEVLQKGKSPFGVWGEEAGNMFKRRMMEERRMNLLR